MLGFGPYSLDLGPKGDEALRVGGTDGRTDGRTDSPCVLQDFVPFEAAAQKKGEKKRQRKKKTETVKRKREKSKE